MAETYLLLKVATQPDPNLFSVAMNEFGCDGIEEFQMDEAQVDELLGERSYSGGSVDSSVLGEVEEEASQEAEVKFYFYGEAKEDRVEKFASFLAELDLSFKREECEVEDWSQNVRDSFTPIEVDETLVVHPPWDQPKKDYPVTIQINPAMAFGTGTHETTFLCLKGMLEIDFNGGTVIDFGAGSGILGIGALKKGADQAYFYDIDQEALKNCQENLELNHLSGAVLGPNQRSDMNGKTCELVFANILLDVLTLERDNLIAHLKPGGHLILSGILKNQVNECSDLYLESGQLKLVSQLEKGDWAAIVFGKK